MPPESPSTENGETKDSGPDPAVRNPFVVSGYDQPRITVYLNGGREVTGVYQGEEKLGDVMFIKLATAEVRGPAPGRTVTAQATLVPVSQIELAKTEQPEVDSVSNVRGSGSRA